MVKRQTGNTQQELTLPYLKWGAKKPTDLKIIKQL